jgi:hypothetical protein
VRSLRALHMKHAYRAAAAQKRDQPSYMKRGLRGLKCAIGMRMGDYMPSA